MRIQIQQIDHSKFPPRPPPIPDDAMSVITNHLEDEETPLSPDGSVLEDRDEASRPEDFSPRLWQLFSRIQRRGTEPLFPADWQVHLLHVAILLLIGLSWIFSIFRLVCLILPWPSTCLLVR